MSYLTNSGLDNFASNPPDWNTSTPISASGAYASFLGVATGSITPSNTTTGLVSEVGTRSNSTGGFSGSSTYSLVSDRLRSEVVFTRVIDFTSSLNLTHWGLFTSSSGGNVSFVDLFRVDPNDNGSSPITLTVQNGDQLQMTFTHIVFLEPFLATANTISLTVNGTPSTPAGDKTWFATSSGVYFQAFIAFRPSLNLSASPDKRMSLYSSATDSPTAAGTASASLTSGGTLLAYTNGNYYRDIEATFSTSQGNGTVQGFAISGNNQGGFKFVLDSSITKTSAQTIKLTFRASWDRD